MSGAPALSRRARAGAFWLALAALASCADDGDPLSTDLPCAIRERACQQAVFRKAAELREQRSATLPKIRVITRAQFAEETRSEARSVQPSRRDTIIDGALRLIAFLPANTSGGDAADEASIAGVAAYYHKDDKAVTIIDDAASDLEDGTYTLAHELVHALQDQREGLTRLDDEASNTDAQVAIDALIEGEAVAISTALLDLVKIGALRDNTRFYDSLLSSFLQEIAASPAPFTHATLTLPYPVGGRPLAVGYRDTGYAAIAERFEKHPLTYAGWVEGGPLDALPVRLRCGVAAPPPGHAIVVNDRFGGAGLLALYTRLGLSGPDAYQAARVWTNDTFTIYAPTDTAQTSAVLAWRIGLRSAEDATQLAARIQARGLPVELQASENELLITGATQPAILASWTGRDECRTLKGAGEPPTVPLLPRSRRVHAPTRASYTAHHHH